MTAFRLGRQRGVGWRDHMALKLHLFTLTERWVFLLLLFLEDPSTAVIEFQKPK